MAENRPRATHSGVLTISNDNGDVFEVQCFVMDNGERVLSLRGTSKAMGLVGAGSTALVRNLNTNWLSPYLSDDLRDWLYKANRNELPAYMSDKGYVFAPFNASIFARLTLMQRTMEHYLQHPKSLLQIACTLLWQHLQKPV